MKITRRVDGQTGSIPEVPASHVLGNLLLSVPRSHAIYSNSRTTGHLFDMATIQTSGLFSVVNECMAIMRSLGYLVPETQRFRSTMSSASALQAFPSGRVRFIVAGADAEPPVHSDIEERRFGQMLNAVRGFAERKPWNDQDRADATRSCACHGSLYVSLAWTRSPELQLHDLPCISVLT